MRVPCETVNSHSSSITQSEKQLIRYIWRLRHKFLSCGVRCISQKPPRNLAPQFYTLLMILLPSLQKLGFSAHSYAAIVNAVAALLFHARIGGSCAPFLDSRFFDEFAIDFPLSVDRNVVYQVKTKHRVLISD